ncbi:hypothetical protein BHE74_00032145 [Ensete ventricosum]|uniref:Uncharacterized protein n=1 Tax=Ensete ventricosum TaxID=4639 RepID=A0A427AJE5_ENSVE|nr:hypothetical protein B296_00023667 [Ensete ventricosum]RWW32295.1 hypothetical protein GW17_00003046 [Ensete ventricosum]RWW60827.1 hypothetical protein BHE74_00032145 [Ensete ventricosum]RZS08163.1 hypothetical protein BHM03_00039076 [Ensete ventricosum]
MWIRQLFLGLVDISFRLSCFERFRSRSASGASSDSGTSSSSSSRCGPLVFSIVSSCSAPLVGVGAAEGGGSPCRSGASISIKGF